MGPYDQGWKAYFDKVEDNPYPIGTNEHTEFEYGHFDAMQWAERYAA